MNPKGQWRDARRAAARKGAIYGLGARSARLVWGTVSIPVVLGLMGSEAYGVWIAISGILAALWWADAGVSDAVIRPLSRALARGASACARDIITDAWRFTFYVAILMLILFPIVVALPPWPKLVPPGASISEGHITLAVALAFLSGSVLVIMAPAHRINRALQSDARNSRWEILGTGISIIILLGLWLRPTRPAFPVVVGGLVLGLPVAGILNTLALRRDLIKRNLMPSARRVFARGRARHLFFNGVPFLGLHVAYTLGTNGYAIIGPISIGTSALGEYAPAVRTALIIPLLGGAIGHAYWGGVADAAASGDGEWCIAAFRQLTRRLLAAGIIFAASITVLWPIVLEVYWLQGQVSLPVLVIALTTSWAILVALSDLFGYFLNALGRVQTHLCVRLINSVILVCLLVFMGRPWGILGFALAMISAEALFRCPALFFLARMSLRGMD
jgi:O-antigen/teichoic acid export membrane protein